MIIIFGRLPTPALEMGVSTASAQTLEADDQQVQQHGVGSIVSVDPPLVQVAERGPVDEHLGACSVRSDLGTHGGYTRTQTQDLAGSLLCLCMRAHLLHSLLHHLQLCGRRRLSQIVLAALHVRHDGGDQLVADAVLK
jgi:hypothetical protein